MVAGRIEALKKAELRKKVGVVDASEIFKMVREKGVTEETKEVARKSGWAIEINENGKPCLKRFKKE